MEQAPQLPTQAYQRYLLQLGFADREVGRLLARLRDTGDLDRSLVIVTADHGIAFRAGRGRRAADGGSLPEIANVPLFVKAPDQKKGRTDDGPARTIDVLPTIAKTLAARPAAPMDGRPLPRRLAPGERIEVRTFSGDEITTPFGEGDSAGVTARFGAASLSSVQATALPESSIPRFAANCSGARWPAFRHPDEHPSA